MGRLGPIFGIFHDLQPLQLLATHSLYSYHSWNNTRVNLCLWILLLGKTARFQSEKSQTASKYKHVFQPMSYFYTLVRGLLAHSWFEIMEFHQILIIPAFWHWKMAALRKWPNLSKKKQYFLIICVESNLTFCRKKMWSFLNCLDYQISEELINLSFKCSFLSFVQVTPRVLVTPFYGTKTKFMISTC